MQYNNNNNTKKQIGPYVFPSAIYIWSGSGGPKSNLSNNYHCNDYSRKSIINKYMYVKLQI